MAVQGDYNESFVIIMYVFQCLIGSEIINRLAYFDGAFPSSPRRPLEYYDGSLPSNNTVFSLADFSDEEREKY